MSHIQVDNLVRVVPVIPLYTDGSLHTMAISRIPKSDRVEKRGMQDNTQRAPRPQELRPEFTLLRQSSQQIATNRNFSRLDSRGSELYDQYIRQTMDLP